jgi:cell division protein FtsB
MPRSNRRSAQNSTPVLFDASDVDNWRAAFLDAVENWSVDSAPMTGLDQTLPRAPRPRVRLPATRGGIAWLAVLLIVGGFLATQFGRQVYLNWEITREADAIRAEIAAVEAENDALRERLAYVQSEAYVSAEARRLTNLGAEGEQVLIIPPGAEEPLPADLGEPPVAARPLLEQWLDLFFGTR